MIEMTATFRDMEEEDVGGVCEISDDVWYCGGPNGISDARLAFVAAEQLALHYMAHATYARVAVDGGRCVGALMASVDGDPLIRNHSAYLQREAECDRMLLRDPQGAEMSSFYAEMHKICESMKGMHIGEYRSELLLFYVRKDCQGMGIGKRLLSDYRKHLNVRDIHKVFLFTNNFCNLGFYEHSGCRCIEHSVSEINRQRFDGYLYEMIFPAMD